MKKDLYRSFTHLKQERPDAIRVTNEPRGSICVVAPHGGGIEPGTSEIAREISGADSSLYLLEGVLRTGNRDLHVTSTNFDDPCCLALLAEADRVVAIHGCEDRGSNDRGVYVGGRDAELRDRIIDALANAGFEAQIDTKLPGLERNNICNRGRSGAGVQLEISEGLRSTFFENLATRRGRQHRTEAFTRFCRAVRMAVLQRAHAGGPD
ncbi:poly-gamma-glutamate hydrolase family protein [Thioalkalivibrio sp.]|uniref:poly-gamma-glutamate hydrolase family protein n=1 Tax=Thioalkalivibrio sp. TaxID=2093813 RepID=UPI003565A72F